jgi:hypothetical protein
MHWLVVIGSDSVPAGQGKRVFKDDIGIYADVEILIQYFLECRPAALVGQ